jgi:hypothetical protein
MSKIGLFFVHRLFDILEYRFQPNSARCAAMRAVLTLFFNPCLMCFALIVGAFLLDDFGTSGRIIGAVMITIGLWWPEILIASGWAVGCSAAMNSATTGSADFVEAMGSGDFRPWWTRRYTLGPSYILLLGGVAGIVIGCIMAIYLKESYIYSFLVWGMVYGTLGIMVAATVRLLDKRHPHHVRFEASVRHASRFSFAVLFALGFWQRFPIGLIVVISGGVYAVILFTLGAVWSLALMVQAAIHFPTDVDRDTLE